MDRLLRGIRGMILWIFLCCAASLSQEPAASPTPDDTVRIPTEEIHLTLHAQGPYPGVVPKLRTDDFTIYENGVAQTVTSMRSLPARVMILLDAGAALTFAKTPQVSTLVAQIVVSNLAEGSHLSVAQYSDSVQTIVPWTTDRMRAISDLEGAVKTGRRSLLRNALLHAKLGLALQPIENRHLILITDGLDGWNSIDPEAPELADLAAANIVVHVLSYTTLEQDGAKKAGKTVRINTRPSKPRVSKEIFDEMLLGLPIRHEAKKFLRLQNESQQLVIIDLDVERRKMLRGRRVEWGKAETLLQDLATETGGNVRTPAIPADLFTDAAEIGKATGSHYDVTYTPTKALAEIAGKTIRKIAVTSRSDSIKLQTRRSLTTK